MINYRTPPLSYWIRTSRTRPTPERLITPFRGSGKMFRSFYRFVAQKYIRRALLHYCCAALERSPRSKSRGFLFFFFCHDYSFCEILVGYCSNDVPDITRKSGTSPRVVRSDENNFRIKIRRKMRPPYTPAVLGLFRRPCPFLS